ncbi:MAG: hypothetical protein KC505_06260 [Myxococcales bacterium]|nr:hypothetical protein [Myxococcales bacterium]USN51167.1 MAG: hypothetical protein H6731_01785 [Myxococcales bacterium]
MRKFFFIPVATFILLIIVIFWNRDKDSHSQKDSQQVTSTKNKTDHNPKEDKFDNETALNEDSPHTKTMKVNVNEILSKLAKDLNRAACMHRRETLSHMIKEQDLVPLISVLSDIAKDQCLHLQIQNKRALLDAEINNENAKAFLRDLEEVTENSRGMEHLKLFNNVIQELESKHDDDLKKQFFLTLEKYVQDASTLIEANVAVHTLNNLLEKRILNQQPADEIELLQNEIKIETNNYYTQLKLRRSNYTELDDLSMTNEEIIKRLGPEGIKYAIQDSLKKELQIAEKFRERILKILRKEKQLWPN